MLYNKKLRRGFLYDKLRNLERNKKQRDHAEDNNNAENQFDPEAGLLTFFKTCVVKNDQEELKKKLTGSVAFRRYLLRKNMIEIKSKFPFYFADPRLVSKLNNIVYILYLLHFNYDSFFVSDFV